VVAVVALGLAAGGLPGACVLANHAAGVVIRGGHRLPPEELLGVLEVSA
jgi:bifunctional ADP-heptose synthase (sugar kinase/adenylyltransferase)